MDIYLTVRLRTQVCVCAGVCSQSWNPACMLTLLCLFGCLPPCQIMCWNNATIHELPQKAFLVLKSNGFSSLTPHLKIVPHFRVLCILTQSFFIDYCFFWIFKLPFCFLRYLYHIVEVSILPKNYVHTTL